MTLDEPQPPPLRTLEVAAMPFPSYQGTQALLREQCEALGRRGVEVHLLVYAHGAWDYEAPGLTVHRLLDIPPVRSLRSGPSTAKVVLDLQMVAAVRWWASRLRVDVVHAHNYEALVASLLARPPVPIVYHAHTLFGPELPTYLGGRGWARSLGALAGDALDRVAPPLAAATLAVSPRLVEELTRLGHPPERLELSLPGIDLRGGLPDRQRARERLGLGHAPVVGYCGNLDGYQGLETLLEGAARVLSRVPSLRLLFVTSSDPAGLRREAARRGLGDRLIVARHGTFDEALERISAADLCVVPRSAPGGFPIKLLTYLAAGRPVVATVAGCAGLDLGEAVDVVPDGDAAALADAIGRALADRGASERRGRAGRDLVERSFSWEAAAARLEAQLRRVLRGGPLHRARA